MRCVSVNDGLILTRSGLYFDITDPSRNPFSINDIAHALSNLCRFNGHCNKFYSVAQHSVGVSQLVPKEHAMAALLHDAAEAYIGDMVTPLKKLIPAFKAIEGRIQREISLEYNVPLDHHYTVKAADLRMLAIEKRDLMPNPADHWDVLNGIELHDHDHISECWSPEQARLGFLAEYYALNDS